jgi:predicted deacetylase
MAQLQQQIPVAVVTIHDACPAFSTNLIIFNATNELEKLDIKYNIALVPFFNEKQDLPRFHEFVDKIKSCKAEIVLHGLYHENKSGKIDDFHTRSRAVTEGEIRAGLEIFQEIGINPNVFVPSCWKLNLNSIEVLEKLRFKLSELQEKYVLLSPRRSKISVTKVLNWDSYGIPAKNTINIARNRRHFKMLIQNKVNLIRIALHPRDPTHALNDQKEMITQLKDQGYKMLKYADLIPKLQMIPTQRDDALLSNVESIIE